MSAPATKSTLTLLVTFVFLAGLVVSGWIPRSCPIFKKYTIGCRTEPYVAPPILTEDQKELNRIPHQTVPGYSRFTAKAQDDRTTTTVLFNYRTEDLNDPEPITFLQFKQTDGSFKDYALVSHPLLNSLNWPVISNANGPYLYQKNADQTSIESFLAHLPAASNIAADRVVAAQYHLQANQYMPLEKLTSLVGISYILTSRPPTEKDDTWYTFRRRFDLSSIAVTDGHISGQITSETKSPSPYLISEIHIDYAVR